MDQKTENPVKTSKEIQTFREDRLYVVQRALLVGQRKHVQE